MLDILDEFLLRVYTSYGAFKKTTVIQNKLILFVTILLVSLNAFGQKRLDNLRSNSNFEWVVDSLGMNLTLYYEKKQLC